MKTIFLNVARILLTGGFVFLAVRAIEFRDSWHVTEGDRRTIVYEKPEADKYSKDARIEFWEGFGSLLKRTDKLLYAACVALLFVPVLEVGLRWHLIMRAAGVSPGFGRAFLVGYIGMFFNNFLPGSVGGDIAKALVAARDRHRKVAIVGTVILDRLIGFAALVSMGFVAAMLNSGRSELRQAVIATSIVFAGFFGGYVVYFNPWLRRTALAGWLKQRLPFRETLKNLDGAFVTVNSRGRVMAIAAALSLIGQSTAIMAVALIARALGIDGPTFADFYVFMPLAFILTAIPVTMGNWGTQEIVFQSLFGLVGVSPTHAIALSLMYRLSTILVSLPGALIFMGLPRRAEATA